MHLWSIGPNIYAAELAVVTHDPQPIKHYKEMLPKRIGLAHVSLEVHRCIHEDEVAESGLPSDKITETAG